MHRSYLSKFPLVEFFRFRLARFSKKKNCLNQGTDGVPAKGSVSIAVFKPFLCVFFELVALSNRYKGLLSYGRCGCRGCTIFAAVQIEATKLLQNRPVPPSLSHAFLRLYRPCIECRNCSFGTARSDSVRCRCQKTSCGGKTLRRAQFPLPTTALLIHHTIALVRCCDRLLWKSRGTRISSLHHVEVRVRLCKPPEVGS